MINSDSFNINEKNQGGNTLLHLILDTKNKYLQRSASTFYDKPLYILIHAALKMGADLTIKINNNFTPIGLCFTKKMQLVN